VGIEIAGLKVAEVEIAGVEVAKSAAFDEAYLDNHPLSTISECTR